MRLSFDVDGVLADFSALAIAEIRRMFVPDLPLDYFHKEWNFQDIVTKKQWDKVFDSLMEQQDFWLTVPAHEDSVNALLEYCSVYGDDEIYFITARKDCHGGTAEAMTRQWLQAHGILGTNVITCRSKEKLIHIIDNGIQFSVDDLPSTVEMCQGVAGHTAYLLDRPWNQGFDLPRVFSIDEFLMKVELSQ